MLERVTLGISGNSRLSIVGREMPFGCIHAGAQCLDFYPSRMTVDAAKSQ